MDKLNFTNVRMEANINRKNPVGTITDIPQQEQPTTSQILVTIPVNMMINDMQDESTVREQTMVINMLTCYLINYPDYI